MKTRIIINAEEDFLNKMKETLGEQGIQGFVQWCFLNHESVLKIQSQEEDSSPTLKNQSITTEETEEVEDDLRIEWDERYSVNIKKIDEEHQLLISLINSFYEALVDHRVFDVTATILKSLINYADYHFADEEKLLKEHNYPLCSRHQEIHNSLRSQVMELQKRYLNDDILTPIDTIDFLKDWLLNHIEKEDKAYAAFLNEKGVY